MIEERPVGKKVEEEGTPLQLAFLSTITTTVAVCVCVCVCVC